MRTLIISLKKQLCCGKMELSTGSYIMLILHVICLLQVTFFCSITSIMFPNSKDVDQFQGCMYCCINQPLKIYAPSLDPYIFQRLHSWPQDVGDLARFNSFQGYLGFLSTQIHSLKTITPIYFKKNKKPQLAILNFGNIPN